MCDIIIVPSLPPEGSPLQYFTRLGPPVSRSFEIASSSAVSHDQIRCPLGPKYLVLEVEAGLMPSSAILTSLAISKLGIKSALLRLYSKVLLDLPESATSPYRPQLMLQDHVNRILVLGAMGGLVARLFVDGIVRYLRYTPFGHRT